MKENIQNGFNPSEWKNPVRQNGSSLVEGKSPVIQRNFNQDWIESALMLEELRAADDSTEVEFNKIKKTFLLKSKNSRTDKVIKFLIKPLSDDLVSVENMKTKEVKEIALTNAENQHPDEDFFDFLDEGGVYTGRI